MTNHLYQRYVDEINRYGTFEEDWDGYGGHPAKPEDIQLALKLLSLWPKDLPLICPMIGNEGTIGFYTDPGNYYMDIEIEENESVSVYIRSRSEDYQESFFDSLPINDKLTEVFMDIIRDFDK